jgi:hypothetical protein
MDNTNKKLCEEFETEMWLFVDHSLEKERKKSGKTTWIAVPIVLHF